MVQLIFGFSWNSLSFTFNTRGFFSSIKVSTNNSSHLEDDSLESRSFWSWNENCDSPKELAVSFECSRNSNSFFSIKTGLITSMTYSVGSSNRLGEGSVRIQPLGSLHQNCDNLRNHKIASISSNIQRVFWNHTSLYFQVYFHPLGSQSKKLCLRTRIRLINWPFFSFLRSVNGPLDLKILLVLVCPHVQTHLSSSIKVWFCPMDSLPTSEENSIKRKPKFFHESKIGWIRI